MKLLYQPDATVGQIVQDLERIVAKAPGIFLEYLNDDGQDMFVEGIKLRKDIAILETTGRKANSAIRTSVGTAAFTLSPTSSPFC